MTRLLYVPLDDRACNLPFPTLLGGMTGVIEVITPPAEMLGCCKRPADTKALWQWVMREAPTCGAAILSVDTLVYGNIVNARIHRLPQVVCDERLEGFRALRVTCPSLRIHAFSLVTRVAGYNNSSEDPDYWVEHGWAIWRHACLTDKAGRGLANDEETAELARLAKEIPSEYMQDFLARRAVNSHVNLRVIDLLAENAFDDLVIPKDDTALFGYAAMDQMAVAHRVHTHGLMHRVMVYPGADEVGSVLLARVLCEKTGFTPRVLVHYSSLLGPGIVPLYEDRPLHESIKAQITSAGGVLADCAAESDVLLAVHAPGECMAEASEQHHKDLTYYSHHSVHEFLRYIDWYTEDVHRACALADVCFANGADMEMMEQAAVSGTLCKIDAYGGWNTAMNTVGLALAHGIIAAWLRRGNANEVLLARSRAFLLRKITEDWFYQAAYGHAVMQDPAAALGEGVDPGRLGEAADAVASRVQAFLRERLDSVFPEGFAGKRIALRNVRFPWGRLFDIDLDIEVY